MDLESRLNDLDPDWRERFRGDVDLAADFYRLLRAPRKITERVRALDPAAWPPGTSFDLPESDLDLNPKTNPHADPWD